MFKPYFLTRVVCYVTVLLLLAAEIEYFKHGGVFGFPTWLSPIAALLLCASPVLLLSLGLRRTAKAQREKFFQNIVENLPEIVACDENGARVAAGLLSDITPRKVGEETLQKLASIVQFSQDAIIGKDITGVITNWNRAAETMYGYSTYEAVGRHSSFLLPPERQAETGFIMERVRSGLSIESLETQRLTKAGSLLDVSVSISPIKDATGLIVGASAIARDITLRKRSEEQLRLQSAALEAAANAIVITDYEGKMLWVNQAFTAMTGYSEQEVLGKNSRMLKSGKQSESYYADLWSTISSGKVWRGEIDNRRKDGTTYTEEMTITPVTRDRSNPANRFFIAIKQDISGRKRSEEMLQNSENKYRVLFEDSADATWLMDEKGFLDCNAAALEMFCLLYTSRCV